MTIITDSLTVYSEDGDRDHPASLELRLDDSQPDCPVTFWQGDQPVFSLACHEIPEFCQALARMNCDA